MKPNVMDRISNEAKFEILQKQDAILSFLDDDGEGNSNNRYALTEESILSSFQDKKQDDNHKEESKVLLIDASVELTQKLLPVTSKNNINVIGVWVSLDSLDKFESRLKLQIDSEPLSEDETHDSVLRGKIKNVIKDIEYGIASGIF